MSRKDREVDGKIINPQENLRLKKEKVNSLFQKFQSLGYHCYEVDLVVSDQKEKRAARSYKEAKSHEELIEYGKYREDPYIEKVIIITKKNKKDFEKFSERNHSYVGCNEYEGEKEEWLWISSPGTQVENFMEEK